MTRLEFVSMSLIKGLKGVISINGEQEIVTLKSIDTDGNEIWVSNDNWVYSSLNYDIKIICRKLSDLTKEIEQGGEKFVPIVEIGKILGFENLSKYEYDGVVEYGWSEIFLDDCQGYSFGYYKDGNFGVWLDNIDDTNPIYLHTSLTAILKLIEWKFDLFGGIDSGDAIDVNSLHENPYK